MVFCLVTFVRFNRPIQIYTQAQCIGFVAKCHSFIHFGRAGDYYKSELYIKLSCTRVLHWSQTSQMENTSTCRLDQGLPRAAGASGFGNGGPGWYWSLWSGNQQPGGGVTAPVDPDALLNTLPHFLCSLLLFLGGAGCSFGVTVIVVEEPEKWLSPNHIKL